MTASGQPERAGALRLADARSQAWSEWGPTDGRPVLLLHGSPGSSHACPDIEATHDLGVRLIAPDRPGFGQSDPRPGRTIADGAPDLVALLDHLSIDEASVVGWSSGGAFALALAATHPARVRRAALVAADAPIDERPRTPDEESIARTERLRADPAAARPGIMERARWFADAPESILDAPDEAQGGAPDAELRGRPDVRAMLGEMFRHAAAAGQAGWVDDSIAAQLPWGFALAAVDRPVTVWYGEEDGLASRDDSEVLAARIPGARLVLLPREGHLVVVRHWRAILESVVTGADGSLAAG